MYGPFKNFKILPFLYQMLLKFKIYHFTYDQIGNFKFKVQVEFINFQQTENYSEKCSHMYRHSKIPESVELRFVYTNVTS